MQRTGEAPASAGVRAGAAATGRDQTRTSLFRLTLILQIAAATFFGIVPFVAPAQFASTFNLVGDEPYLIRLAGAATIGYAAAALIGLIWGSWTSLRIPIAATFTFNVSAAAAAFVMIDEQELAPLPLIVGIAASAFVAINGYWLWRNEGPSGGADSPLEPGFRLTLAIGTVAATTVALWQLLLPRAFATFFGLSEGDLVIIRPRRSVHAWIRGRGPLGVADRPLAREPIQTIAAITSNAAAAIASAIYVAQGGKSLLGILFFIAAGAIVLSLTAWAARAER